MSGLDLVYENMKAWRKRLPNVLAVSAFLFEDEMRIRIDWYGEVSYTYVMPQGVLEQQDLDAFGDMILSEAEKAYKIHTVGEE